MGYFSLKMYQFESEKSQLVVEKQVFMILVY